MRKTDVCIIGAGAAGLAAAACLDRNLRVFILEKNKIPGRKILATGGGRCNMTNQSCSGKEATLDFFASLGLEARSDEEGRYYPYSGRASDVVTVLLKAQGSDTKTLLGFTVKTISSGGETAFQIGGSRIRKDGRDREETICADYLILATGGKASPKFGTAGDGYALARSMGHSITRIYPILTGIRCRDTEFLNFRKLNGIRARGTVRLMKDGLLMKEVAAEKGEIQFTEDGLSGICVFNLTPYIRAEKGEKINKAMSRYSIAMDLAPDFSREQLAERNSTFGILTEKLAEAADREIKANGSGPDLIKNWVVGVECVKGWQDAQCTAGGVNMEEINMETMESLRTPRLYIVGELLDRQGPCGGFNLQNAWETGLRAARAINTICSGENVDLGPAEK